MIHPVQPERGRILLRRECAYHLVLFDVGDLRVAGDLAGGALAAP